MTTPAFLFALAATAAGPGPSPGRVDYLRDVKPVLAARCYACHGALKQKAGLRLDTSALIRKGGHGGPAVEPGDSSESPLVERVTAADDAERMPPEGSPLSRDEIDRIRVWIDQGAEAPAEALQPDPRDHWAFRPPVRPAVPGVADPGRVRNPIDAFLAAERDRRGLKPVPPADRAELLRRVSLDLTGLAPTPAELRAFLADGSADAYEREVDRLLDSPRYGERWGRHWMDVWRYSDWAGFGAEVRESQPHIWHWRDWIVESLNADKGYDRMVAEMLAADEIAPGDPAALRATGYLVRNWYKFNRNSWVQNTVEHTAKAFLGLTVACARCHDHKYDPIRQEDYYGFRAVFEPHDVRTDRVAGQADTAKDGLPRVYDARPDAPTYLFVRGDEKNPDETHPLTPRLPAVLGGVLAVEPVALAPTTYYPGLAPEVQAEAVAKAGAEIAPARTALDKALLDPARPSLAGAETTLAAALWGLEATKARVAADRARYATPRDPKAAEVLAWEAARVERLAALRKAEADLALSESGGDAGKKDAARKAVEAARLAAGKRSGVYSPIGPVYPATSTGRRLALARRVTARDNPLAARVAVNHIWMRHFGRALVPTVFDLGLNGKPPSHPALLDWLAVEFMERGWRMKPVHRLIVTSDAYRMRSTGGPDHPNHAADPGNVTLWRMNPRRMEAEAVRDNVLNVAGRLDAGMGGPDIDPASWISSRRRSLYFRHAAEKQVLFLSVFDAANVNACYRRDESVVPQQALALANSPLALAGARLLARDLSREADADDAGFIAAAFERVLGRGPTGDEHAACVDYLTRQASPGARTAFATGPACEVPPSAELRQRAREGLVHVLINHNDFVTIR